MPALTQGLVQVYTGEGKGKTTAALGLVLRAAGWGLRSYIAQLMKQRPTGEEEALGRLAPLVTLERFGRPGFVTPGAPAPEDCALAREGVARARAALVGGAYDLVVVDEALTAVALGLLAEQALLDLIAARPAQVELVLTGRGATPGVVAAADLVTRTVEEKHPYARGIPARRGIEF